MASIVNKARFHIMRSITNKYMRDSITNSIAKRIGKKGEFSGKSQFVENENSLEKLTSDLIEDGIVFLPIKITEETINQLVKDTDSLDCHDPYRKHLGNFKKNNIPDEARLASYSREDLTRSQTVMDIANDPVILKIVQEYLGATPTISSIDMWWSIPKEGGAKDAQIFHRDVSDYKFIKLFIYLTDVDKDSGPHLYIKKTVNSPEFRKVRRYSDEEIYDKFGKTNVLEIEAPKGTSFLEDTYGFHKGVPPASKIRLLFQVQYSLNPIFGYTYNPVDIGNHSYNKYINRLFIK